MYDDYDKDDKAPVHSRMSLGLYTGNYVLFTTIISGLNFLFSQVLKLEYVFSCMADPSHKNVGKLFIFKYSCLCFIYFSDHFTFKARGLLLVNHGST